MTDTPRQSGVRSCTKGSEGEQNLPAAARKRETARHCRAPRGAADLSGARSVLRILRRTCRSIARTPDKKRWLPDAGADKQPGGRRPKRPHPAYRDGHTQLEHRWRVLAAARSRPLAAVDLLRPTCKNLPQSLA